MMKDPTSPVGVSDGTELPCVASRRGRVPVSVLLIMVVLTVTLSIVVSRFANNKKPNPSPDVPVERSSKPSQTAAAAEFTDRNPGYVGIDTCAECHQERVQEFRQTNHFRTCRVPVPEELPTAFRSGEVAYTARFPGTRFRMQQIGDEFFQTTIRSMDSGQQSLSTRIDLVLGAGQTDDIYLAWHDDGRMFELPIAWFWPMNQWAASHFMHAHGVGDYSRVMTVRCLECHNTWMQYEPGTVNLYRRETALLGVTCEKCHGPGNEHVAVHRANPEEAAGLAIVRPSELDRERLTELCTQCHSNAVTHRRSPFSYRPGEPLEDFYRTQQIPHPEDDHVANQIQHLRDSACWQNSPDMSCITCHSPHHNRPQDESPSDSCRQCHQPHDCGEQQRLPEPLRDDCAGCHMPARIKINVKFELAEDNFVPATRRYQHRIAVDPIARDEMLLKWYRGSDTSQDAQPVVVELTERLSGHWEQQATTHEAEHRYLAAIAAVREALAIDDTPPLRKRLEKLIAVQAKLYDDWALALQKISENRFPEAMELLKGILAVRPDDAEAHSKLGTIYAMRGMTESAITHLKQAAENDPNSGAGYGVLGRIAWMQGNDAQALEYWLLAEQVEPFNAQIQFDLGQVLLRLDRTTEAIKHLEWALVIDPTRMDIATALNAAKQTPQSPRP